MSFEILRYTPLEKGSLQGFFSLKIAKWGQFVINDMRYFAKEGGARWIAFPQRQYEKDGEKKYAPYCKFEDRGMEHAFGDQVLKALDAHFAAMQAAPPVSRACDPEDQVPF